MALKGKPVAIGNTATTIYTCPATKEAAVHGLLFGNNTASALAVDVIVYNQATGSDVTVVTDLAVPANGVATWSKPINLNAGDAVKAVSSAASGMVCLYSTYEDGATPVASGFTARGTWSSAASYVANDIVSVTGSGTYVAIQASTNQDPTTATAYWMYLEGISASALPVQAGNAGKYLTTDGTDASWGTVDVSGGATVTTMTADLTLTSASTRYHKIFCNTNDLDIILPNATSLNKGESFHLIGYNGTEVSIKDSSGGLLSVLKNGGKRSLQLIDNSTAAGTWTCENTSIQAGYSKAATLNLSTSSPQVGANGGGAIAEIGDNIVITVLVEYSGVLRFVAVDTVNMTKGTSATITTNPNGSDLRVFPDVCKIDTNKFACIYYRFDGGSTYVTMFVIGTVDANQNVTLGTPVSIGSSFYNSRDPYSNFIKNAGTNKFIAGSITSGGSDWTPKLIAGTVSGTSISFGSTAAPLWNNHVDLWCLKRSDNEFHVFETDGGSSIYDINKFTLSGTSLSRTTYQTSIEWWRRAYYNVSLDANNDRHVVLSIEGILLMTYNTGTGQYEPDSNGFQSISNFTDSSGFGVVRIDDDTVGLIGTASGGLEGTGTSFRTATWNSTTSKWEFSSISLLESSNVMTNFIPTSYIQDRDFTVTVNNGSVVYTGAGQNYFLGKIGTTVVG